MQQYGVPPGQIRTHLNVNVNKQIFYSIRRDTIYKSKAEDINDILTNPNNKRVAESEFSADICYLDDTMCTNIYERPVQLAISVDPQDHSQTLSFSILEDKTKDFF